MKKLLFAIVGAGVIALAIGAMSRQIVDFPEAISRTTYTR
jgi:hypothetical protein